MNRFRFARLHGGALALLLLTASPVLAQSNGNAAPAASTPLPTGLLAPLPAGTQTPPPGFVVVQTTYLESLVAAQKATLDSVAATSQASINAGQENVKAIAEVSQSAIIAARDKEEWLVRLAQTIGIVFSAIAALLTYFGITKYSEVKGWLAEIEQSKTRTVELRDETLENARKVASTGSRVDSAMDAFQAQETALKAKIEKADQTADAFAEKLGEMEQLFTGMHSQRLILDTLKGTAEEERKEEALAVVDEIKVLYDIAEKHNNQRIVSFLAATLSLVYMYAKQWDEAVKYGEMSIQCNPRRWDDRLYNLACVHAMKFQATKDDAARQSAVSLLRRYFEQKGVANVAARDLSEALLDEELGPIVDEIKALILEYRKHYEVTGLLAKTFAVHKKAPDKDAALALLTYCLESSSDGRDDVQRELMNEEFKPLRSEIDAILLNWRARQA